MKIFNDPRIIMEKTTLVDSFLTFVKVDTQSDAKSQTHPSTQKQFDLLKILKGHLDKLGCEDVLLDDKGYLYGTLPGNTPNTPVIGLLAHVDTATDFSGTDVLPLLHENYDGAPITLHGGVVIDPAENPELTQCVGDTIITASGDTLLGADDKAGVAEIIATLEMLVADDTIPRPTLRIAFTPDEEIGQGASNFDIKTFDALCAYTIDGGFAGEVNFETFSADKADVIFTGVAVHPGFAKDKLVNALRFAGRFLDRLPIDQSPERTEDRQGFFHPTNISGNAAKATVELILRDFDNDALVDRGERLKKLVESICLEEPKLIGQVIITEQYRNMADTLKDYPKARENLIAAVKDAGVEPDIIAIRGGTDGSGLTAKGLPTPNIFSGGINFHGPRECISTRVMGQAVCSILNLVQRWAQK